MDGDHPSIFVFVKHNSQVIQPLDRIRRLHHQFAQQFRPGRKMSAAKGVQVVLYRRVVFLIRRLDSAFRHHGVGIPDPQLGHDHHVRSGLMGLDGC